MTAFASTNRAPASAAKQPEANGGAPGPQGAGGENAFEIATRSAGVGIQRQAAPTEGGPFGSIVEDDVEPGPGQIRRAEFVAKAVPAIEATASSELARYGKTAKDCPYLEHYVRYYRDKPAAHIERMIAKYARPEATDAASLIESMLRRVRQAISTWAVTGTVDLPSAGTGIPGEPAPPAQGFDGPVGAASPQALRGSLGAGRPLDGATRSRMERGFGRDFGDVRIHTDAGAGRAATSVSARAFTVGRDIAFGAGQFRPGTPRGDLMLAHELAHVVQQGGSEADAQAWSSSSDGALEEDADRAAVSAVAQAGLAPEEIAEHVALHPATDGAGLRLQRCRDDYDYSEAPEPPAYDAVVTELRELYARKAVLGRADPLDEKAYEEVNAQIQAKLEELRLLGVSVDEFAIEQGVTATAGPTELRVAKPRISREPATGPLYNGRRIKFRLATDWLPPDEIPQITWRWNADGDDFSLLYKTTTTCELDEDFWGLNGPGPAIEAVPSWRKQGGAWFYAVIKLGEKEPIETPKLYVPWDDRLPHEIPDDKFEIEPIKPVLVVGEAPDVHIKHWVNRSWAYWIEWTVDGVVVNFHKGIGGGVMGRPFDSPGTKTISARLFRKEDVDAKDELAHASTTIEVQDVVAAGRQALAKGEEIGAYTPLSDFRKSHDSAMEAMGTRAKLGETGSAKEYWQKRLNAERERLESLEEKVPDWEKSKNVTGKEYAEALGKPDAAVTSTPIPTVLVYPSKGGQVVQPLSIYLMTRKSGEKWSATVVDISGKVYAFNGDTRDTPAAAAKSAFEYWKDDNKYPTGGTLVYTFSPPGWDFDKTFSTSTAWKYAEEFLDGLIAVGTYVAIGLLMLAPDATVTKVLGVALMAAVAARGVMAIADNMAAGGKLLDRENILEAVVIVTAIIGGGGAAAKAVGSAARIATLARAGNWMIMTSFVVGAGTFVYATAEAVAAIRGVLKDPTLTDADRSSELLSIIGNLIANGTMMIISAKALWRSGLKASDFFKETIPPKGSGPIEMTEGMRIDIEVELRKRGVPRDALKEMTPEVLLDNYYSITAAKPELPRIPEAHQALPAKEAAAMMGLPEPPPGYYWTKNGDRLSVARKPKAKGEKLVYDPEGAPGKEFIPDPTVGSKKPFVARVEKVVPASLEAPAKKAVAAREAIADVPEGKTGARAPDGTTTQSGWGSDIDSLKPVEKLSAKIGHEPAPNINDAPGRPGSYNNSHAEKQLAALKPGEPIGVSRVMCIDCQIFFAKLATSTGKPVVVSDPMGVRIFLPNQPAMLTAPNAAAVPGIVAAASRDLERKE